MKIVHVTEAWNGGISTYVNMLIRHHAASDSIENVSLIYSENESSHDFDSALYQKNGVRTYSYQSSRNPLKILGVAKNIDRILSEIQPDIVHLHSSFPGVYGRLMKGNIPVVYCAHGWSFVEEQNPLKRMIYGQAEKFLARRTDAIVNISQYEYGQAANKNVRGKINTVILNGVDDVKKSGVKPDIEINPEHINIGYIGRLDPKKGFDIAAGFFENLSRDGIHLHVIGAPYRDKNPVPRKDSGNIHYLGWVDHDVIDDYIALFDALIVPSRHEAFGLVVIEAMRNAKPVIASRRSALPELVKHGENGFLFDIDSAQDDLEKITSEFTKSNLKNMGLQARQAYEEKFTAKRFAGDVLNLYRNILESTNDNRS